MRHRRERRHARYCVAAIVAMALAGSAVPQIDRAPDRPDRPWQPRVAVDGEIVPGRPDAATVPSQGYTLPTDASLAILPAAPAIDADRTYDLADLIDLAESHDPRTRIAWDTARAAALAAGIARSTYLPRLTATALGGYQATHGRSSGLGLSSSSDSTLSGSVSALSLQWLLFDFGQRRAVVESADQATIVADIGFTAAHQRLIHQVSIAFYAYSAARTRSGNTRRSLDDARTVQDAAEDRFARGIGTVIEVAQAKQATAQAHLAQVQAKGEEDDAYVTLLAAIGIPPLTRITIADASGHPLSEALAGDVDKVIAAALGRRPDVLAAYAALKGSLAAERAAKAEFLPKLFVSGNAAYSTGDLSITGLPAIGADQSPTLDLTRRKFGASIIGGITVPLFDGGSRRAALSQARTHVDGARLTLDQVRTDAVQQIVLANNALRMSLASHDAARELLAASQTTFDAALAAYRSGVGSSTEMIVAERQLLEARTVTGDSYSAALSAAATLALAAGSIGGGS